MPNHARSTTKAKPSNHSGTSTQRLSNSRRLTPTEDGRNPIFFVAGRGDYIGFWSRAHADWALRHLRKIYPRERFELLISMAAAQ
jgi:hypothetical protein